MNEWFGFQDYSLEKMKNRLKKYPRLAKEVVIVKEERPYWLPKGEKWRQVFSFQEKKLAKELGLKAILRGKF